MRTTLNTKIDRPTTDPLFLPTRKAVRLTGISEQEIRRRIHAGTVPGIPVGSRFLIDVTAFIDQLRAEAARAVK